MSTTICSQAESIKGLLDWATLLRDLGTPQGRFKRSRCPICQSNNPTVFSILPHGKRGHCFRCGFSGDQFDLLQKVLGLDFRRALQWAANRVGVPLSRLDRP